MSKIPKWRIIIYWIIIGVVVSLSISAMIVTRDGGLHQFFDDGYVWEMKEVWDTYFQSLELYDEQTDTFVMPENGIWSTYLGKPQDKWNYLIIDIKDIVPNTMKVVINGYNREWVNLARGYNIIVEGENIIKLPRSEDIEYMYAEIQSAIPSYRFSIEEVRIAEYAKLSDYSSISQYMGVAYIVYLLLSIISIIAFRRWTPRLNIIERLSDRIVGVLIEISRCMAGRCSGIKYVEYLRSICFIAIYTAWRIANTYGIVKWYGLGVVFHIVMFAVLIMLMPVDRKDFVLVGISYKAIVAFYLCTVVSDIIVVKEWGFVSIWMTISFGIFLVTLGRSESPEYIFDDIARGIEWILVFNIFYGFYSPNRLGNAGLISGTWMNQNPYAITMALYVSVVAYLLYKAIVCRKYILALIRLLEIILGVYLIIQTKCRTAVVAMLFTLMIVFLYIIYKRIKEKGMLKYVFIVFVGVTSFVSIIAATYIINGGLIDKNINTKDINSIASNRITIWMEHIKSMNLFGHEGRIQMPDSQRTYAHDVILKVFYKWGVITGIAGMIATIETICMFIKQSLQDRIESAIACIVGMGMFIIPGLLESMNEYPNTWINSFFFYIVVCVMIALESKAKCDTDG